jgi:membrane-associated protein
LIFTGGTGAVGLRFAAEKNSADGTESFFPMLDLFKQLVDFILHIDVHLAEIIRNYGVWTYAILFAIIFAETGFVVTPFLPGDSLLFAAGAFCAKPETGLNVHLTALLLWGAATLGDTLNYWLGAKFGAKAFKREDSIFLRKKHLERAHAFFERFGGRAIILARFMPVVRTFVPFVAGMGKMSYARFLTYNVVGGFLWIYGFVYLGYQFGNMEAVQKNFKWVIIAILALSMAPIAWELAREYLRARRSAR